MRSVVLALASLLLGLAGAGLGCNGDFIDPSRDATVAGDGTSDAKDGGAEAVCQVELTWDGAPLAGSVAVSGDWDGFSTAGRAMARSQALWLADLQLAPGEHAFRFVVNGVPEAAPGPGIPTHWVKGVEYRNLAVPDCTRPSLRVASFEADASGVSARVCFVPARDGAGLARLDVSVDGQVESAVPDADGCVTLERSLAPGKHRIDATAEDAAGRVSREPLWIPFWIAASSAGSASSGDFDWRDATLYMVMPDRFRDGDGVSAPVDGPEAIANWQGGDLVGVGQALDEGWFDALGVTAIWLTPVLAQPEAALVGLDGVHVYAGYHGYWPVSVDGIEPRLGGASAFREVVEKAHARGIRVVMDVVLNHVHEAHPYCAEGLCHKTCVCGTSGCDWDARARDCQFAAYLPDLDYREHETVVRVADDLLAFVRDHDIDGLRIDAVKHVDRTIVQAVRARTDAVTAVGGAPFWLIGETFTGSDGRAQIMRSIEPSQLDGQFDFPLYWAIRDTFVSGASFRGLESAVAASEASYGAALPWMSPFLGNHDVPRFATAIAGNDLGPFGGTVDRMALGGSATPTEWDIINRQSMAFAFLLTSRGIPLVYMGDELGLGGSNDPDNRRILPRQAGLTPDQAELLRRVRELGVARHSHAVLRRGARRELWIDDDFYLQVRWLDANVVGPGEARVMIVAMNKGTSVRRESVTVPTELGLEGRALQSLFSARVIEVVGGKLELELAPMEYAIFGSP